VELEVEMSVGEVSIAKVRELITRTSVDNSRREGSLR
jgi:hypothetical protein